MLKEKLKEIQNIVRSLANTEKAEHCQRFALLK